MGPIESHEKKVFRKNPNMGLQAILKRLLSEFNVMENPDEHLVPKNVEQMGAECLARMQALFIQKPYCPVAVYGNKDNLNKYFWPSLNTQSCIMRPLFSTFRFENLSISPKKNIFLYFWGQKNEK